MKSCAALASLLCTVQLPAQLADSFDGEPIHYRTAKLADPITHLQRKIDRGDVQLKRDKNSGYLRSLLEALEIPEESQMLVFSKTSFQLRLISPRTPRAVYFGDDVYIGWVQGADVLEVSSVDPELGGIFYTLSQRPAEKPRFQRRTDACLQCHASALTLDVPGHIVRSIYPAQDGQPILRAGTHVTSQSSPLRERWGGWYVTGTHGKQRHMGNVTVADDSVPRELDLEQGANLLDLSERFDTRPYLTPYSDIVALMVLEHQNRMHNLIAHASYESRQALHQQDVMNRALDRPNDHVSPTTKRRIARVTDKLVDYMLFVEEASIESPIRGSSGFREVFSRTGPQDPKGRSLRELDLDGRLMKYPCSYLIYSPSFDNLPEIVRDGAYRKLWNVLTERDDSPRYNHLSTATRDAIFEILLHTKEGLPDYWRRRSRL